MTGTDSHDETTAEETKRRFREALEKKNAQHHATAKAEGHSKITNAHGAESSKREFRRKSG